MSMVRFNFTFLAAPRKCGWKIKWFQFCNRMQPHGSFKKIQIGFKLDRIRSQINLIHFQPYLLVFFIIKTSNILLVLDLGLNVGLAASSATKHYRCKNNLHHHPIEIEASDTHRPLRSKPWKYLLYTANLMALQSFLNPTLKECCLQSRNLNLYKTAPTMHTTIFPHDKFLEERKDNKKRL